MTRINLIEQKKYRLEQQKNRLKEQEAYLNQQMRKARTRKLIELGGLVSKAELENLPKETLYGALLSIKKQKTQDEAIMQEWTSWGKDMFNADKQDKTAVIVSFKQKPSAEVRDKIREAGLKWNAYRKEWQGHVYLTELKGIVEGSEPNIKVV